MPRAALRSQFDRYLRWPTRGVSSVCPSMVILYLSGDFEMIAKTLPASLPSTSMVWQNQAERQAISQFNGQTISIQLHLCRLLQLLFNNLFFYFTGKLFEIVFFFFWNLGVWTMPFTTLSNFCLLGLENEIRRQKAHQNKTKISKGHHP